MRRNDWGSFNLNDLSYEISLEMFFEKRRWYCDSNHSNHSLKSIRADEDSIVWKQSMSKRHQLPYARLVIWQYGGAQWKKTATPDRNQGTKIDYNSHATTPGNTYCNNNVIIVSKRSFDVIMTSLWHCLLGFPLSLMASSSVLWVFSSPPFKLL